MRYLIIALVVIISGCASTNRCESYQCDYQKYQSYKAANPCTTYEDNADRHLKCLRDQLSYSSAYSYVDIPAQNVQTIQAYPNFISLPGGHGMMCNMGYCYGY